MSLTLAPSASSPTPSRWIPPSWLGRSESYLELRNRAKGGTQKNHHSGDLALLDSLLRELQDITLTGAISSAFPHASSLIPLARKVGLHLFSRVRPRL